MNASVESAVVTNAASTGIRIERAQLKSLARRSNGPGLTYLALWALLLALTGALVWFTLGTPYVWGTMFVSGVVMSVPSYALSHETAHGTAFRTRWLNEAVLWFTSLLYGEEPLHRRYTHTNHHTHTWYVGFLIGHVIECPLHQGRFDIRTGEVISPPPFVDLNTYPVKTENGEVYVKV